MTNQIAELALVRKEIDECRGIDEIVPIDYSAEEIADAVNKYLNGLATVDRELIKLVRWTNLNMLSRQLDFTAGTEYPVGSFNE